MEFQMDIPIYIQIATLIKEEILSGTLEEDQKIPSVREMSVRYEVSALTVQRAIGHLESEKITESKKGVGSFVRPGAKEMIRQELILCEIEGFVSSMRKRGLSDAEIRTLIINELERK